jgi:gamma-glutamyl-gamma-aminobutyrate hydrolase PuuD
MYRIQLPDAGDDLGTIIATLITTQQAGLLPPHYRPLIGMLASPSTSVDGQRHVMSTDLASIEAVLAAGGEVRLIPVRLQAFGEETFELVLHTVLQFDGLLFSCSGSDVDPRLDSREDHPSLEKPESLLDWWMMLMALVARETLTPLFGICRGAAQLQQAFGGMLRQQRPGQHIAKGRAHTGVMHSLDLDPERLALCVRGGNRMVPPDYLPSADQGDEVLCLHHYELDTSAPDFLAWSWTGGRTAACGNGGPLPWFALATLFHAEARVGAGQHGCLSPYLFEMYVRACRAYAGSLRQGLKSTRLRDRILRRLYADPLAQRFLPGPPVSNTHTIASS